MVKAPVDLYDSHYDRIEDEVYRSIRAKTFGTDLGQESWITAEECDRFRDWLGIKAGQRVLEVACGSGGVALRIAEGAGVDVVGTDLHPSAIAAARKRSASRIAASKTEFLVADADAALPFPDRSFDAVLCNDAINHFKDRRHVLTEWGRVLRDGGRCLFTDPVVVTGLVSNAELAARSSIGFFLFSVAGTNEALLRAAGFAVERAEDVTPGLIATSHRWREARAERRADLLPLESEAKFEAIQQFLAAVHRLAAEGRLSRFAFVGRRGLASQRVGGSGAR